MVVKSEDSGATSCMTMAVSNSSAPQFPHLFNGHKKATHFIGWS